MALPESRLPNEVWGQILENVWEYDKSTLKSFSLTCRAFCGISRPRLFSKIRFIPYATIKGALLLPSPTAVNACIERLDFLCSNGIAPLVRQCHIFPHKSYYDDTEWSFSTDTPYLLLDALFERLSRFTGLQRLDVFRIPLTQSRVDILFHLPHLSELHVSTCTVTPGDPIALSLKALQLSDFELCHDSELEHGADYWIPLLHPGHLRTLKTAFVPRFMHHAVHTIPSFPNVHTLKAIIHDTISSQNLTIKFPGVRVFKLWGKGLNIEADAGRVTVVFPHLEEYYGPYEALPLFLTSTLTRIQTECPSPEDFLTRIQVIHGDKITSLNAKFEAFDNTAFDDIVKLLPHLRELLLWQRRVSCSVEQRAADDPCDLTDPRCRKQCGTPDT
ncbi:hypothetical protein MSAN_01130500 [Mycena sanguinolenta]|uniref:F-box domain-containing protein n=1 Tax=Mycena sanguinolenta TaxID=230812 RepID=A0A8H7D6U9_9AGAR|nr:hypothetical protein MSAN_01130500 [Mycena sanguinolenta]